MISYDLLWTIFGRGDFVLSVVDGRKRSFTFESGEINPKNGKFEMEGKCIDFDGDDFGYVTQHVCACL